MKCPECGLELVQLTPTLAGCPGKKHTPKVLAPPREKAQAPTPKPEVPKARREDGYQPELDAPAQAEV